MVTSNPSEETLHLFTVVKSKKGEKRPSLSIEIMMLSDSNLTN